MTFDWLQSKQWWLTLRHNTWDSPVVHIFIVLVAAGLLDMVARRFMARVKTHVVDKTENPWDDSLLAALPPPLRVFIWVVGLRIASLISGNEIFTDPRATQLFVVVCIATTSWFLVRWIRGIEDELVRLGSGKQRDHERLDETTIHAVGKLLRLATMLTAALVALQYLNIDISAVLTFGGIGGIAIGFAAKDLLANFFGGLTVYLDRPFNVGDWIRSPDRELEGTVEYIGWRHTRIRTFDKRPLYVPNAIFTTIVIENPQRMLNRRIYETIGIRYDDIAKMDAITRDVKRMLQDHPDIDQKQLMMVYFNSFAASSCDFFIYTFTETTNWAYYHEVKHGVLLKVAEIIASHGAEIAFPTSTLHIASAPPPPEAN